jgi:hypothetical protein
MSKLMMLAACAGLLMATPAFAKKPKGSCTKDGKPLLNTKGKMYKSQKWCEKKGGTWEAAK